MIISFNGDHGSGKSTIAKKVAEKLNYPRYYMGQIFRDMAKDRNITVSELLEIAKKNTAIDDEIENYVIKLGENEDNFIIESRTAWHFIPKSIKIYFKVNEIEGAKRIFLESQNSDVRSNADKQKLDSVEKIILVEKARRENDINRYKQYYNIDICDEKNYDFIIDTTNLSKEEVFDKVMDFINLKNNK